jgi:hypothetical protein
MKKYQEKLERYQFQMGPACGRLATALDVLTDTLALVGQHGVYCRNAGRPDREALDIRMVMGQIEDSKSLIMDTMKELRTRRQD